MKDSLIKQDQRGRLRQVLGGLVTIAALAAVSTSAAAGPKPGLSLALSIGDPAYRDCVFDRAGVARKVRDLDHLDRDLMFLAAARNSPDEFLSRHTETDPPHPFNRLFSRHEAASLQRVVKAHAVCHARDGRILDPWPLESAGAGR